MPYQPVLTRPMPEAASFDVTIAGGDGTPVFQARDIQAPAHWSQTAVNIFAQKYLRRRGIPALLRRVVEEGIPPRLQRSVPEEGTDKIGFQPGPQTYEFDERQVCDGGEVSIFAAIRRLAGCWAYWGLKEGYFDAEEALAYFDRMRLLMAWQAGAPNSPQWFNTGLHWAYGITGPAQGHWYFDRDGNLHPSTSAYERPQPHACFIQSIDDDLVGEGGIMDLWNREARLFKYGSGTGTNFSSIRAKGEPLSGGGTSSGLLSFLKIGDRAAGAIKSGGTTRRAAKMVCLDVNHPDIEEFIDWKVVEEQKVTAMYLGSELVNRYREAFDRARNEKAALQRLAEQAAADHLPSGLVERWLSLIEQGEPLEFIDLDLNWQGEGYQTVSGQNANNSVRVSQAFMEAVIRNREWSLIARTNGEVMKKVPARRIWDKIARAAWQSADPGLQFDTTINDWHTCPEDGRIRASNPCVEYMFLDNTACNLASINLLVYWDAETGRFDSKGYQQAIQDWITTLDISVSMAQYPSREVAERSRLYRTLGLGFANLGALLMQMGLAYDSDEGRAVGGVLASLLGGTSFVQSGILARRLGTFPRYDANAKAMTRVVHNHTQAHDSIGEYEGLSVEPPHLDQDLLCKMGLGYLDHAALGAWCDARVVGDNYGYRNAQLTCIAPTGTISFIMDCDTTGIEPDYALVKSKALAGGGQLRIVNQSVGAGLTRMGYVPEAVEELVAYCQEHGHLQGRMTEDELAVFACAHGPGAISVPGHIRMMAAVQPFICGAISKTVNLPSTALIEDIEDAYTLSWELGIKAMSVYRDASKMSQPLNQASTSEPEEEDDGGETITVTFEEMRHVHRELPAYREGYTRKLMVGGTKFYLRTGEYEDGTLGEIFVDMSHHQGTTMRSMMNVFAKMTSIALQAGVPLEQLVESFCFTSFDPAGMVYGHEDIKMATSVIDLIFRDLAIHYLGYHHLGHVAQVDGEDEEVESTPAPSGEAYSGNPCPECHNFTLVRNGTCMKCETCGGTTGCS